MGGTHLAIGVFSAVLGMFQYGYTIGAMNAPQAEITSFIRRSFTASKVLTDAQAATYFSVAVSVCLAGGMIGAIIGGEAADRFGRRKTLLFAQISSLSGSLLMGVCDVATSYTMLVIGRLLAGLSCGLFTSLVPLYVTEISPIQLRGAAGTLNQLAVTTGILISNVLGLRGILGGVGLWPLVLAFPAFPALTQIFLLGLVVPESPRYLMLSKGKESAAKAALIWLRETEDVGHELTTIKEESNSGDTDEDQTYGVRKLLCTTASLRLPLFVCVCLHLSQQFSGIVAIFYYSTDIFRSVGINCDASQYATLGVGATLLIMTLVTVPLMDRLGRRTLHLLGLAGILVCGIGITIALNLNNGSTVNCDAGSKPPSVVGIFLIIFTLAFVAFFAVGPGSVPWMVVGEMFTQGTRAAASSVCVFVNWVGNLLVSLSFPQLQITLGDFSFVPFMGCVAVLFALLLIYFPETRGLAPSEMKKIFSVRNAWKKAIGMRTDEIRQAIRSSESLVESRVYGSMDPIIDLSATLETIQT